MENEKNVFIGCDAGYDEAAAVIFGAPFDSTTSYRPGTRFGCSAIRHESFGIETYSPYLDRDLADVKVFDSGDIELCFGSPEAALEDIEKRTAQILSDDKLPVMLGGEHLVTLGAVRAAARKYDDLHIIQFDAHADLRDDYLGQKLSHACVMRRCYELVGERHIHQFGIRSGERTEFEFAAAHTVMHRLGFKGLDETISSLGGKKVYLTIDLDVLDPSELPGTGTPEAGGASFLQLHDALNDLSCLDIIGADINELSPHYDQSGRSTALACKLLRELLLMLCR
ncbi:MAG: agmatinase [Oscillospiraceae bacterium]|nr:agmatinase [Oscillospiraceae bacterium]